MIALNSILLGPAMKRKRWSNAKTISTLLTGPLVMGVLAVLLCACGAVTTSQERQTSFTTMMKVALDVAVKMEGK